jgi:hypothetical protein
VSIKEGTYYSRNRDRLLEKANLLYKTDKQFRERRKVAVNKWRRKRAKEKKLLKEKAKLEKKIWKVLKVNGVETPCCKLGYLAKSLNRSTHTLRVWEGKRYLPPTIRYNSQRYYPVYHYLLMVRSWESRSTLSDFVNKIWSNWESEREKWLKKNPQK